MVLSIRLLIFAWIEQSDISNKCPINILMFFIRRRLVPPINWNINALENAMLLLLQKVRKIVDINNGICLDIGTKSNASDEHLRAKSDVLIETDNRHNDDEHQMKRLNRKFGILCTSFGRLKALIDLNYL